MYLCIIDGNIGFKHPEINTILESDKEISDEIYNKFFELQAKGKEFKIKNINGASFEEIFEEVIPVIEQQPQPPTNDERLKALENAISTMMGV